MSKMPIFSLMNYSILKAAYQYFSQAKTRKLSDNNPVGKLEDKI